MMPAIFISGASRGLGFEWARQYAQAGWRVYASCRHPEQARELQALANANATVSLHRLDVSEVEQLRTLQLELEQASIDVLVNNAGVYLDKFAGEFGGLDFEAWRRTFEVNTLGPARLSEALLAQVARSDKKLLVAITSHMGSITDLDAGGSYAYRASKAALNTVMKGLSLQLAARGIGVLMLHPGWVRTRMGGADAPLTPEQSVRGMRELVEHFSAAMNGRFFAYDGHEIAW